MKKEERRGFLRVRCSVPFAVVVDGRSLSGASEDVSASGVRGKVRGMVPSGDIDLHLTLPFGMVVAHGRVVRSRAINPSGMSEVALSYVAPDPRTEDRIVSFVLARERELVRVRRE